MDGGLSLPLRTGINAAALPPSRGSSARIHKIREKATKLPVFHSPARFPTAAAPGASRGGTRTGAQVLSGAPPARPGAATALIERSAQGGKEPPAPRKRKCRDGSARCRARRSGRRHAAAGAALGDSGGSAHLQQGPAELLPTLAPG